MKYGECMSATPPRTAEGMAVSAFEGQPDCLPLPTIYLLDGSRAVTGAFVCARNEAKALVGIARVVLVLPNDTQIPDSELVDFYEVRRLGLAAVRKTPLALFSYLPRLLLAAHTLLGWMREHRAERLQVNDFYLLEGAVCRLLGFAGHLTTWVRIHPSHFGSVLSRFWLLMVRITSDRVVAVSEHIRNALPARLAAEVIYDHLPRVGVVHGLDERSTAKRRLVCVSNYIEGKGQDDALEAFAIIAPEFDDLILEFWGGDMDLEKNRLYRARLQQRARDLGLNERVFFGGFIEDVERVLHGAYAALNFSRAESFSMTVLEACAAGLAVVATRSGGPGEIIVDGVTGLLVPVSDHAAMARALRFLVEHPQKTAEMGSAAKHFVSHKFSREQFRSAVLSVLLLDKAR